MSLKSGVYLKSGGDLQFTIDATTLEFGFQGAKQPLRPVLPDAGGAAAAAPLPGAFCIDWRYGQKQLFQLQQDGISLHEVKSNGSFHVFRLQGVPTTAQLCHLRDVGSLQLHGAVSPALVDAAKQSAPIVAALGKAAQMPHVGQAWLTESSKHASLLALAEPGWPAVCAILGCPDLPLPSSCQIAIKVGTAPGSAAAAQAPGALPPDSHIDGLYAPDNGVPINTIHNFSLLLGVSLTDMPNPNMGNLGVFPGSHLALGRAVGQVGLVQAVGILSQGATSATQNVEQLVGGFHTLAPPQPLCGMQGMACLLHYQSIHFVQPNTGAEDRVMVYFRVTHPRRQPHSFCPEALENIFVEMPGLSGLPK
jgi:hypothetical protein